MSGRAVTGLVLAAVLLVDSVIAQPQKQQEIDLQAAIRKETVDGDLKGAIKQYSAIVAKYASDRPVAAMALVHMAECYQKLGDNESQKLYDRVLREYGDQKEAVAVARERLGGREKQRAVGDRPVWTAPFVDGFGTVSPDGRYLTYTDWPTNAGLVLRDLTTGTDRRLTTGTYADGQTLFSAISKDGKQVAYDWLVAKGNNYELRIASLAGSGLPQSRRIFYADDIVLLGPLDWSPDNKRIAVGGRRTNSTGIVGILNVEDGTLRVLKSVDWQGPRKVAFSPDGRHIAYDAVPGDNPSEHDVFIVAVDGTGEIDAVKNSGNNVVMGWSADGTHLFFASNRSGSTDLWALRTGNGKPQGAPQLVKANIGTDWSMGITAAGSMYVWKASPSYVAVSDIDLAAGKVAHDPAEQFFIRSRGRPDWSADGKQLVYTSCAPLGGGPCSLYIRSMENGQVKEFQPKLASYFWPRWSPDGRSLLAAGIDLAGQRGIYSIDPQTGAVSLFMKEFPAQPEWSADGAAVYYARSDGNTFVLLRRDAASGEEREVLHAAVEGIGKGNTWSLSPDGRFVAAIAQRKLPKAAVGENGSEWTLLLIPVDGGQPRALFHVTSPERLWGAQAMAPAWTPDGHAVMLIRLNETAGQKELWLVPVAGDKPRKFDVDISHWTGDGFRLSPDGRRIAFVAGAGQPAEIWALENFLPKVSAKR